MTNITQALQPDYFAKFGCNGNRCDAHCCRGWDILIDEATHEKYRLMPNRQLSRDLMGCLTPSQEVPGEYRMAHKPDGSCSMLDEQRLCRIQRECGEEYLSDVCRRFPRYVLLCGDILFRSLSLVCPVAARLVLTNPEPMRLELTVADNRCEPGVFDVTAAPIRRYWCELLGGDLAVLQRRDLSIDERLALLGDYWDAVDEQLATGVDSPASVAALGKSFAAKTAFTRPAFDVGACVQALLQFLGALGPKIGSYLLPGGEEFQGLRYLQAFFTDAPVARLAERYIDLRLNFERRVVEPYCHMLENYLASECLVNLHPCQTCGGNTEDYRQFVTIYKLMETTLMCVAAAKGEAFTVDDIIATMEWAAQANDHNTALIAAMRGFLGEQPTTLKEFMATWLVVG